MIEKLTKKMKQRESCLNKSERDGHPSESFSCGVNSARFTQTIIFALELSISFMQDSY